MGIYEDLGVRRVINASGTLTRVGGSRMSGAVLEAMAEAASSFVYIDELQDRAGSLIASVTGAEAGYVTGGAASAVLLGTAACVAGLDVARMALLPDTTGMRDEVIVQRAHRNPYDHAVRAVGVRLVEVAPGVAADAADALEAALTGRTAAIYHLASDRPEALPLATVTSIARRHGIPVIVDAAAALPPRANLRRFIDQGADLVAFSGGKSICGPQGTGILAGRRDLIDSVALQHQDMDVHLETWSRRAWVEDGRIGTVPGQGLGRPMKVSREDIVGLMTALRIYADGDDALDVRRWDERLAPVSRAFEGVAGVTVERTWSVASPVPRLRLAIDARILGVTATSIAATAARLDPPIVVGEADLAQGALVIDPRGLDDDVGPLIEGLRHAIVTSTATPRESLGHRDAAVPAVQEPV